MDTQGANQGEQRQPSGQITGGIDMLNKGFSLARSKNNPLGRMGGKVVVQAGKKIATSIITTLGPWIWAIVVSVVVSVITFLITLLGGSID
jgi:hypothetical protein